MFWVGPDNIQSVLQSNAQLHCWGENRGKQTALVGYTNTSLTLFLHHQSDVFPGVLCHENKVLMRALLSVEMHFVNCIID